MTGSVDAGRSVDSEGSGRTVAVVGLGLIGGSFALAMKQLGARVVGLSRSAETVAMAKSAGAIDDDDPRALADAELIFIAVPVCATDAAFAEVARRMNPQAVAMDGGSVKGGLSDLAKKRFGENAPRFVPCHPVAGAETSGFPAARADLFCGRDVVLCPAASAPDAADVARDAWQTIGARVSEMDADEHDRVFAVVSHLPHLLSYALVNDIDSQPARELMLRHAASGFRDFTRIAGSHPEMWRDICLQNQTNLLSALSGYRAALDDLESAIASGDGEALFEKFDSARELRTAWAEALRR